MLGACGHGLVARPDVKSMQCCHPANSLLSETESRVERGMVRNGRVQIVTLSYMNGDSGRSGVALLVAGGQQRLSGLEGVDGQIVDIGGGTALVLE